MALTWICERGATWDADKRRIVGEAPRGAFDSRYRELAPGAPVPGEWWRVDEAGKPVAYGWLEVVWGDAEVLLATSRDCAGRGVGSFVLEHLEKEARARGLNYTYNVVRPTHPDAAKVSAWLVKRGFRPSDDGRLLRAVTRQ